MAVQARSEYPERASGFTVDLDRARLVATRLREMQAALGLTGDVTLDLVARQPDVLSTAGDGAAAVAWSEIEPIVAQAAAECRAMRAREGEALAGSSGTAWTCSSRPRQ